MANLSPISKITNRHIKHVIRGALQTGLNADLINDFLASVDWSGTNQRTPRVAAALGQLEGWATLFASGDITHSQYVARLLSLLPPSERNRHLFLDGGRVAITIAGAGYRAAAPQLARSDDRPQTGSRVHPQSVPAVSNSDIARVA